MAIADIDDRRPTSRRRPAHHHMEKTREPSLSSSLGMCLMAAILLGLSGWIAFEVLMTLVTLD